MDLSGQLPLHLCSLDGRTHTDRQTDILSPQLSHMCLLVLQTALKHHQTVTVGKKDISPSSFSNRCYCWCHCCERKVELLLHFSQSSSYQQHSTKRLVCNRKVRAGRTDWISLHLSRVDFMGGGTGLNADGVIILQPSHSL